MHDQPASRVYSLYFFLKMQGINIVKSLAGNKSLLIME